MDYKAIDAKMAAIAKAKDSLKESENYLAEIEKEKERLIGRKDTCLEGKSLLGSYDKLKHEKNEIEERANTQVSGEIVSKSNFVQKKNGLLYEIISPKAEVLESKVAAMEERRKKKEEEVSLSRVKSQEYAEKIKEKEVELAELKKKKAEEDRNVQELKKTAQGFKEERVKMMHQRDAVAKAELDQTRQVAKRHYQIGSEMNDIKNKHLPSVHRRLGVEGTSREDLEALIEVEINAVANIMKEVQQAQKAVALHREVLKKRYVELRNSCTDLNAAKDDQQVTASQGSQIYTASQEKEGPSDVSQGDSQPWSSEVDLNMVSSKLQKDLTPSPTPNVSPQPSNDSGSHEEGREEFEVEGNIADLINITTTSANTSATMMPAASMTTTTVSATSLEPKETAATATTVLATTVEITALGEPTASVATFAIPKNRQP